MKKAITPLLIILLFSLMSNASVPAFRRPFTDRVPVDLPDNVSINNLDWVFGGHLFDIDPHTGVGTFTTKSSGSYSGAASITYIGIYPEGVALHLSPDAKTIFSFQFESGIGSVPGDYGFSGILDACTQTGQVSLWVADANGFRSWNISNEVVHLQCEPVPVGDLAPKYLGYLDSVDCTAITGWVADLNNLNTPISVDVFDDGVFMYRGIAASYRPDVGAYIGDNGLHGFRFPSIFNDGHQHKIDVRFAGTGTELQGSPKAIACLRKKVK